MTRGSFKLLNYELITQVNVFVQFVTGEHLDPTVLITVIATKMRVVITLTECVPTVHVQQDGKDSHAVTVCTKTTIQYRMKHILILFVI